MPCASALFAASFSGLCADSGVDQNADHPAASRRAASSPADATDPLNRTGTSSVIWPSWITSGTVACCVMTTTPSGVTSDASTDRAISPLMTRTSPAFSARAVAFEASNSSAASLLPTPISARSPSSRSMTRTLG